MRFNASGPVPHLGHFSFQYISRLFQPWLWRPPKRRDSDAASSDGASDTDSHSDSDSDSSLSTVLALALLLLVAVGVAVYVARNRDLWNGLRLEFGSPYRRLGFEHYMKNEVIDEMGERSGCASCNVAGQHSGKAPPAKADGDDVGLEKYLRRKAKTIISRLN